MGIETDLLMTLVDKRKLRTTMEALEDSGDSESANLIREVVEALLKRLQMSPKEEDSIRRLIWLAEEGGRSDPELIRNNVFKAANGVGIKTHGFF